MLWNAIEFACWADGSGSEGEAGVGEEPGDQLVAGADALDAVLGRVGDLAQVALGRLASSVPLRMAHRYSTGLSSGAWAGSRSARSQSRWLSSQALWVSGIRYLKRPAHPREAARRVELVAQPFRPAG